MQIYLDYSATTPPRPEAIAAMTSAMTQSWGNPSSLHQWGSQAATVMETARIQVAALIGASAESVVFTASGSEANNLAIMGVAQQYRKPRHMIISAVEHSAIAKPIALLEQWGWQITRLFAGHESECCAWRNLRRHQLALTSPCSICLQGAHAVVAGIK